MWEQLLNGIQEGDIKSIARSISLVENEQPGYHQLLSSLPPNIHARIIGITGPPGAGKSTLTDALIGAIAAAGKRVAVLCVDPSSPFNMGSVLGDRIRMMQWHNVPHVFIRSLATRGSLGGLSPKIIEITEVMKAAGYDYIIVETVGVGQSEIEIAGLADITVVVLVPESGDEVQTMKAGLMEIADIFVVNKADRPGADRFIMNLRQMLAPAFQKHHDEVPVISAIASQQVGITALWEAISRTAIEKNRERKNWLLTEKVWQLIQAARMKDLDKKELNLEIKKEIAEGTFNLYRFAASFTSPAGGLHQ